MKYEIPKKMIGMKLPGRSKSTEGRSSQCRYGPGQVLLKMKAASLCGSDLKYIYLNIQIRQVEQDMTM